MSPTIGLPPPEAETCLVTSRVSRFKGGTIVAEDARDLATHARRVADPDGYRPSSCLACGRAVLHVHGYRERRPRADPGMPPAVTIVLYICAHEDCGATWRILPIFLARHLWRTWRTVEWTVMPEDTAAVAAAPAIPARTRARWLARLAAAAFFLLVLFAASGGSDVADLAADVDDHATRRVLVKAYAQRFAVRVGERLSAVATLTHRLERGIRLM